MTDCRLNRELHRVHGRRREAEVGHHAMDARASAASTLGPGRHHDVGRLQVLVQDGRSVAVERAHRT